MTTGDQLCQRRVQPLASLETGGQNLDQQATDIVGLCVRRSKRETDQDRAEVFIERQALEVPDRFQDGKARCGILLQD